MNIICDCEYKTLSVRPGMENVLNKLRMSIAFSIARNDFVKGIPCCSGLG